MRALKARSDASADRLLFFAHEHDLSLGCTTLARLHELVQAYVARWDDEIEAEVKARRFGRPKTNQHIKLEQSKANAEQEYREGFRASSPCPSDASELPDLTHEIGIAQLRHFSDTLDGDISFIPRLRLVRIFRDDPTALVVDQPGAATVLNQTAGNANEMDEDEEEEEEQE